jgi:DNA-binding response OmpR family regulator
MCRAKGVPPTAMQPSPSEPATTAPLEYSVVILAEDDPVLRRGLSDFLADEGFLVREAHDVAGIRHAIADNEATALVLDIHLGDETVASVVAELARSGTSPNVVLISAGTDGAELAKKHGIQLLAKPFDLESLVQALLVPLDERPSTA